MSSEAPSADNGDSAREESDGINPDLMKTRIEPTVVLGGAVAPPIRVVFGPYTLERVRRLGEGGECVAWLYRCVERPDQHLVVKHSKEHGTNVLRHQVHVVEEVARRCDGTHDQLQQLHIPNLHETEERLCDEDIAIFPYADGVALSDIIDHAQGLPSTTSLHLGVKMAERMAQIHAAGVAHRDIKPDNTLVITPRASLPPPSTEVEIIDFGLADIAGNVDDVHHNGGSPWYAAPEQWNPNGKPDVLAGQRADMYAFGHVLFEAHVGRRLFKPKASVLRVIDQHWRCVRGGYASQLRRMAPALADVIGPLFVEAKHRPRIERVVEQIRLRCAQHGIDPDEPLIQGEFFVEPPHPVPAVHVVRTMHGLQRVTETLNGIATTSRRKLTKCIPHWQLAGTRLQAPAETL